MSYQNPNQHVMHSSFLLANDTFIPDGVIGLRSVRNRDTPPTLVITGLLTDNFYIGFNYFHSFLSALKGLSGVDKDSMPKSLSFPISSAGTLVLEKCRMKKIDNTEYDHYRLFLAGKGSLGRSVSFSRSRKPEHIDRVVKELIIWLELCLTKIVDDRISEETIFPGLVHSLEKNIDVKLAFHSSRGGQWYSVSKRGDMDGVAVCIASERGSVIIRDDVSYTKTKEVLAALKDVRSAPTTEKKNINHIIDPETNLYVRGLITGNEGDQGVNVKINCDDYFFNSSLLIWDTPKRFPLKAIIDALEDLVK